MGRQYNFQVKVDVHVNGRILHYEYSKNSAKSIEIHFSVPFSVEAERQVTEITLYNINPGDYNAIRQGSRVDLHAGYAGDVGLLMSGTVFRKIAPTLSGADTAYVLRVLEGPDYTRLPKVNITFAAGTRASTIVREVARRAKMSLNFVSINNDKTYADGYTAEGHPLEVLSSIADDTKTSLFYLRGKLTFAFIFKGRVAESFLLTPSTGLVGSPTSQSRDEDWKDGDDDDGYGRWSFSCTSILNYHLTSFSRVELKSKYLTHGMYVTTGEHSFDGKEPRTTFEGIEN